MKRTLLILLVALPAIAGNVYVFDPVTRHHRDYITSQHTPAYQGRTDVLIDPALPVGIPLMFTKETNGVVVAMSLSESNAIVASIIAALDTGVRADASAPLKDFSGLGLLMRAFADLVKDDLNILRNEISIDKTNEALFRSRPILAPRTFAQLQTAITNKIASRTVDTNTQISFMAPRKRSTVVAVRAPKDIKR